MGEKRDIYTELMGQSRHFGLEMRSGRLHTRINEILVLSLPYRKSIVVFRFVGGEIRFYGPARADFLSIFGAIIVKKNRELAIMNYFTRLE